MATQGEMIPKAAVDSDVFDLVKHDLSVEELILLGDDLDARDRLGWQTHDRPMQAHDGRHSLQDAYEEALDGAAYLRKARVENPGDQELATMYWRMLALAVDLKLRLPA